MHGAAPLKMRSGWPWAPEGQGGQGLDRSGLRQHRAQATAATSQGSLALVAGTAPSGGLRPGPAASVPFFMG